MVEEHNVAAHVQATRLKKNNICKRLFDVLFSLIGIIILSPLMLMIAAVIKSYDSGPVIYKQVRLTKDEKNSGLKNFDQCVLMQRRMVWQD